VHVLILLEHLPQVVDIVLQVSSLVGILSVEICITLFVLNLLFHVFLVKSYDSLLQLLEISNVMEAFKYIILELLLIALLLLKLLP
jgi:hypothetical protein